jgi:hypothetical protein
VRSLIETKTYHPNTIEIRPTYELRHLNVPALAVVAVVNVISGVRSEHTWHTTAATSRSIGKAITEDSVGSGDRSVLVAHFCCVEVEFVWCLLDVLDLIWISGDGVLLCIGKFSREGYVLVSQRDCV